MGLYLFANLLSFDWLPADWMAKIVTLFIGALGGWISGTIKVRGQQRAAIDATVHKLLELSMEYPHVERESYCASWDTKQPDDDDKSRYESYCCALFNTIEHAWELTWPWGFSKRLRHWAI